MRNRLGRGTRAVALVIGTLSAAGAVVAALGDGAWLAALELGGLAALCLGAAWTGADPENPDGAHRSFRVTELGAPAGDRRATPHDGVGPPHTPPTVPWRRDAEAGHRDRTA